MKTLAVYFSKTGNTQKVAEALAAKTGCDLDALAYDEAAQTAAAGKDPGEYDHIILLSPVWAFSLALPMKLYIKQHAKNIKSYSLIVTCGGFGLQGALRVCKGLLGKAPEQARKIRSKAVKDGTFTV